ncbi:tRNA (adenosine(37)-N6)-threonylcarbamoyltransferase complex ATPase subunit type 1 TsaE [bacterium]|nr:tRNA (adenosine(37)-N6)-threonylcarbamoyltransferase complex ATPase subunit type 1 TsaE [bacterium]
MKRGESGVFYTASPEESEVQGKDFAALLLPGDVILLDGQLGAGKTAFTAALCQGFSLPREAVASPTYTILRQYFHDDLTINHWDFYRISSLDELEATDFFELTADKKSITIVEWASLFPAAWNDIVPRCNIAISIEEGSERREFKTEWHLR